MATQKHLTLDERMQMQVWIEEGLTKAELARRLNKDPSTIAKEIRLNRSKTYTCKMALECAVYKQCKHSRICIEDCPQYEAYRCRRRDVSPGACNGCSRYQRCRYTKYRYNAVTAEQQYRTRLVDTRVGLDLDQDELERMATIVCPLIKKGHSPYVIVTNHPELGVCEKTLYNYVTAGLFRAYGVLGIDLRFQVSRKKMKTKNEEPQLKKRKDKSYLIGRTYEDYLALIAEQPLAKIVQMDTVYNRIEGPYLQTFKFLKCDFLFALWRPAKTAACMNEGLQILQSLLGPELVKHTVEVLLTDRGSEFLQAKVVEENGGTKLFYCDPMAAGQKGSLEKRHAELRYIVPKHKSFEQLNLMSQERVNLVLSHLNSYPRERIEDKTPYDLLAFHYPEALKKFLNFGLFVVPKDDVILNETLLTKS